MFEEYVKNKFSVNLEEFIEALKTSPSAEGYIRGAISEILLKKYCENNGYEVIRIKEKPSGGNDAKNKEAMGDFYIRSKNSIDDNSWLVLECKGLKSHSEFRGGKLSTKEKVFKYLLNRTFDKKNEKVIYDNGYKKYNKTKEKNGNKIDFPEFKWDIRHPGPESYSLDNLWSTKEDLHKFVYDTDSYYFTEEAYRNNNGIIKILETHTPTTRISNYGIKSTAPLVSDFSIMAVDLHYRTGKHEFIFMNPEKISHSPTSPEHIYQNYTVDIIPKSLKVDPVITKPWYKSIDECIIETEPKFKVIDKSQIDQR